MPSAMSSAIGHESPPGWVDSHEDGHRDAERHAGRQVDLAKQQDEDERHAERGQLGGLREQVGDVAFGQEVAVREAEEDHQEHDEATNCGQSAHFAAAHCAGGRP